MKAQIQIITPLGEFNCDVMEVTTEEYQNLIDMSKEVHTSKSEFYSYLEDGVTHITIPPDIIRQSIVLVKVID